MRTLNISISDTKFNQFGLKQNNLTFSDLIKLIRKELVRKNLNKCLELAEKYGLSKMTMDEISEELKAVRRNAKSSNCYKCYCFFTYIKQLSIPNYLRTFG